MKVWEGFGYQATASTTSTGTIESERKRRGKLQYIRENEDRLDRLKAEKRGVLRDIKGLEEMGRAVEEVKEIVETGETAEIEQLETPPSIEIEESETAKRYEMGEYVILQDKEGYHVRKGDQEIGSFAEGKVLEEEDRALFELDKGMQLEISRDRIRKVMSPEKAGLCMLLKTDGWVLPYRIGIRSQNPEVVNRFAEQVRKVYKREVRILPSDKTMILCYGKDIVEDLREFGPFDSRRWRVSSKYLTKEGAREVIISIGDTEGTVHFKRVGGKAHGPERYVEFPSINRSGLAEVRDLLSRYFDVDSRILGPYYRSKVPYYIRKGYELVSKHRTYDLMRSLEGKVIKLDRSRMYFLRISKKENLRNFYFGCYPCFTIREKRETLERALGSYKRRTSKELEGEILETLRKVAKPICTAEVGRGSNIDSRVAWRTLRRLHEKGIVDCVLGRRMGWGFIRLWSIKEKNYRKPHTKTHHSHAWKNECK